MGYADLSKLRHLVLDEVDRMLDMGFIDDITRIMKFLPEKRQTLFFSATMPPKIRQLAVKLLHNPVQINISISKPAEGINQSAYLVHDAQKLQILGTIFRNPDLKSAILFAGTRQKVKEVERELRRMKFNVGAIHSDIDQQQREDVLLSFRNRKTTILVATDVVSRGIDVQGIELVVNYDVPGDPEDYVHRIGRTARAETKGEAITLINGTDIRRFQRIEEMIEKTVPKLPLPEGFAEGPDYSKPERPAGKFRNDRGKPSKPAGATSTNSSESPNGEKAQKKPFKKRFRGPKNNSSGGNPTTAG
jgi:superfamily II DNA/RNA helicase